MNNPKIEEIVKSLRGCVLDGALTCDKCVATGEMDCNCRSELMLVAADLIEQLQQELIGERYRHDRLQDFCVAQGEELSALKAQQRWIPGAERLPAVDGLYMADWLEDGERRCAVLGFAKKGESVDSYAWRGKQNIWYCEDIEWGYLSVDGVAHWRELPEPPKE